MHTITASVIIRTAIKQFPALIANCRRDVGQGNNPANVPSWFLATEPDWSKYKRQARSPPPPSRPPSLVVSPSRRRRRRRRQRGRRRRWSRVTVPPAPPRRGRGSRGSGELAAELPVAATAAQKGRAGNSASGGRSVLCGPRVPSSTAPGEPRSRRTAPGRKRAAEGFTRRRKRTRHPGCARSVRRWGGWPDRPNDLTE